MIFNYMKYSDTDQAEVNFWTETAPIKTEDVKIEGHIINFFESINSSLKRLGGYGPKYRTIFREIGVLEGVTGARFYRSDNGQEYTALRHADGSFLKADSIVDVAFIIPFLEIRNRRAIRPLRVKEGQCLHLVVDADFRWYGDETGSPGNEVGSFEAELA
ncbi:hypothetical protein [Sphingomonas sp. CCH13-B11]|nr:hypothetical protein [Sphingomonas sp. CCH13-B11]